MSSSQAAAAAAASPGGEKPAKKAKKSGTTKKSTRVTTGVMDYLQSSLARSSLLDLYSDETRGVFVCRAVLQRLPDTSQQIVIRLSCCGGSFPKSGVGVWTKHSPRLQMLRLEELYLWAIIKDVSAAATEITLTDEFAKGLKDSLHSLDASPWTALSISELRSLEREAAAMDTKKSVGSLIVTPEELERHTQLQWDAVLHYLVGTPNLKVEPNPAITHFLLQTNLMQPDPEAKGDPDEAPLVITQKGYDFMLQDNAQQVWHFVVQYLQSIENHKKAKELKREALLLLICLSYARLGECYVASSLSKDSRVMMKDLALFGLLYVRKVGKTTIFYPTRVAMQLVQDQTTGESGGAVGGGGGGQWFASSKALEAALSNPTPRDSNHLGIIVQTNFQLCAYTTSELHVSMLGLFCDVHTIRRLPNVVFMVITRDSIKAAFALGIQAQQILRFLEKHAHPKLRSSSTMASPIPSNVIDQIWLWDRERHRVKWREVFLHQCMLDGEFHAVQKYASEYNAHVWSSEGRNQLFLDAAHAERITAFVRQWRAKTAAG